MAGKMISNIQVNNGMEVELMECIICLIKAQVVKELMRSTRSWIDDFWATNIQVNNEDTIIRNETIW